MPPQADPNLASVSRPAPSLIAFTITALIAIEYLIDFAALRAVITAVILFIVLAEGHAWGLWRVHNDAVTNDSPSLGRMLAPLAPLFALIATGTALALKQPTLMRSLATGCAAVSLALGSYLYGCWIGRRVPLESRRPNSIPNEPIIDDGG